MNKSHQKSNMQCTKKKLAILFFACVLSLSCATPIFASDITVENISYLVNQKRIENGLQPLNVDSDLNTAATSKSDDMMSRDYFEHFAFGMTPWDFINKSGYKYLYAGENLAMDFDTAEGTVNGWMNSPKHRENILNPDYEDMGIGITSGVYVENNQSHETTIVTNMFGRKKPMIVEVFDSVINNIADFFSLN
jgi:uncharacterized protein YkwD